VIRILLALLVVLAACTPAASSPTMQPTPTPSPTPQATDSPSPEPTEEATPETTASASEGSFGGFSVAANPDADALFAERNTCQNLDDGYEVDFPAEWNTNAEFGAVPPCSWFAATEYETGAPGTTPDEVAIELFVVDGERSHDPDEIESRDEGFVGVTQPAFRVVLDEGDGTMAYEYVIQLGPTPEEGPNLVARTSSEMGGDFDLNRAVLDRMMATMEFIGTIE
jgi:hypothetical protein